jgi:hypothetical protein
MLQALHEHWRGKLFREILARLFEKDIYKGYELLLNRGFDGKGYVCGTRAIENRRGVKIEHIAPLFSIVLGGINLKGHRAVFFAIQFDIGN